MEAADLLAKYRRQSLIELRHLQMAHAANHAARRTEDVGLDVDAVEEFVDEHVDALRGDLEDLDLDPDERVRDALTLGMIFGLCAEVMAERARVWGQG